MDEKLAEHIIRKLIFSNMIIRGSPRIRYGIFELVYTNPISKITKIKAVEDYFYKRILELSDPALQEPKELTE